MNILEYETVKSTLDAAYGELDKVKIKMRKYRKEREELKKTIEKLKLT